LLFKRTSRALLSAFVLLTVVRCAPEYEFDLEESEVHCGNGRQDAKLGETGLDCGGSCDPCAIQCSPGTGDCDGDPATRCETVLLTSVENCGDCGEVCQLAGAESRCLGGECLVKSCVEPFANCNARSDDGCEVNVSADAQNCGSCGKTCSKIHGAPSCENGRCLIRCDAGWDDCNDNRADGCERPMTSDTLNCGECGHVCHPAPKETPFCKDGTCGSTLCEEGLGDCDGDGKCEQDLSDDPMNCGRCGNPCVVTNGVGKCVEGVCEIDRCDPGFENCDGDRADGGFFTGCEANLKDNVEHCGSCGNACGLSNAVAGCENGKCRVSACDAPYADCNGDGLSCETDTSSDATNCGGCASAGGVNCGSAFAVGNADAKCEAGRCTFDGCHAGYLDCNEDQIACEVDRRTDAENCGACDVVCRTGRGTLENTCTDATCKPMCESGYLSCDEDPANGCESNTQTDLQNCGACGAPCRTTGTVSTKCEAGECVPNCTPDRADCDDNGSNGCETTILTNSDHCGGCKMECERRPGTTSNTCSNGTCDPDCANLFGDCDDQPRNGCETSLGGNDQHCGACNRVCREGNDVHATSNTCNAQGNCVPICETGWGPCGDTALGCTTPLDTAAHCGNCETSCSGATNACVAGRCQSKITLLDENDGGIRGGGTLTITHNLVAGSNRLLLVVVTARAPNSGGLGQARPDSVTYDGVPLTFFNEFSGGTTGTDGRNHFFSYYFGEEALKARGSGMKTVTIRGDAPMPAPEFIAANVMLFDGVRQTEPITGTPGRSINASCETMQPSATVTTTAPGAVAYAMVAAQYPGAASLPAGSPVTRLMEFDFKPGGPADQSKTIVQGGHAGITNVLPAGTVTLAWSYFYCTVSEIYAVVLNPIQTP
jgi:hypothetical protein